MAIESSALQKEWFFFALRPPRQEANRISAWLHDRAEPGWDCMLTDRLHLTLAITPTFDHYPGEIVERLLRAGAQVAAAPFVLKLDRLSIGSKSAALRPSDANADLRALQQSILRAMATHGAPMLPGYGFNPHVTLAYRQGPTTTQHPVEPFGWDVTEFVLIRSLIGRTRHITLGTWPLTRIAPKQYALF